jgi:hypothetical protein
VEDSRDVGSAVDEYQCILVDCGRFLGTADRPRREDVTGDGRDYFVISGIQIDRTPGVVCRIR